MRQAYPDGVVWIAAGQKLTDDDLLKRQRDLARHLGGDGTFASLAQGQGVLRPLLAAKAVLLVLDDVWQAADAQAFDVLGPRCRMLVTTRDKGILDTLHGELVPVSLFTEPEALQLLADAVKVAPAALPAEARKVARKCGLLPLALALCGGMARKRGGDFHSVLERLRRADLEKIADRESINEQHRNIWRAMQASVEMLPDTEQQRFAELAVFDTDQTVPEAAAATLWAHTGGLDDLDTEELLINLGERSLVQLDQKTEADGKICRRFSLHDLLHDYAARVAGEPRTVHQKLLDAYRKKCPEGWHTGPNDGYFYESAVRHALLAEDLLLATDLMGNGFLDRKAQLLGDSEALSDARAVAIRAAGAGSWNEALLAAGQYCTLAERCRNDPSSLAHFATTGKLERVHLILEAEPDLTRRALMGLAASELAAGNGFAPAARELRAEVRPLVERSLRTLPLKTRCLATRLIEPDEAPVACPPTNMATVRQVFIEKVTIPSSHDAEFLSVGEVIAAYAAQWTTLLFPLLACAVLLTGGSLLVMSMRQFVPAFREMLQNESLVNLCLTCIIALVALHAAVYFGLTQVLRVRRGRWERRFALWEAAFATADQPRRAELLGRVLRLHALLKAGRIGSCGGGPICSMLAEQFSRTSDEERALLLSLAHHSDEAVRKRAVELLRREPPGLRYAVVRALLAADIRPVRRWWFLGLNEVLSRPTLWIDEQLYSYRGDDWLFFRTLCITSSEAAYPANVLCDAFATAPQGAEQPDEVERVVAEAVQALHAVPRTRTAEVLLLALCPPVPTARAAGVTPLTPPVVKWPLARCETMLRVAESLTGWTLAGLGVASLVAFLLLSIYYIPLGLAVLIASGGLCAVFPSYNNFARLRQAIALADGTTAKFEILFGGLDEDERSATLAGVYLPRTALAALILHPVLRTPQRLASFSTRQIRWVAKTLIRRRCLRAGADLLELVMSDRVLLSKVGDMLHAGDVGSRTLTEEDQLRQLSRCLPSLSPVAHAAIVLTVSAVAALVYWGSFAVLVPNAPVEHGPRLDCFLVSSLFLAVCVSCPSVWFSGLWRGARFCGLGLKVVTVALWGHSIFTQRVFALAEAAGVVRFLDCYWLPGVTTGLLVPWAIELWRGANLLYPTSRQIRIRRLSLVGCGMVLAVAAVGLHVLLLRLVPALQRWGFV